MGTKQLLETNTQCLSLDGRLQGVAFFSSNIFVFRNFHFKGREGEGKGGRWQEKALFPPRSLPDAKPNIRNSEEEEEDEEDRLPLSVLWGFFLARRG